MHYDLCPRNTKYNLTRGARGHQSLACRVGGVARRSLAPTSPPQTFRPGQTYAFPAISRLENSGMIFSRTDFF
jgi:hypothetical protein